MADEPNTRKNGVLFLCTGNACRSQMAEGFAKSIAPDDVLVFSAGTFPAHLSSRAVRVMQEIGIDISNQYSKRIDDIPVSEIGTVITLCDSAERMCPSFPAKRKLHWPIPDPVGTMGDEERVLREFRKVRDMIMEKVENYFKYEEWKDE
ncbi:MAG: hypothetical protein A3C43_01075 [Candidatus Schekmanbacteria bacterium RIFCSPHIGHO2_02_FULL_38_11]|uniref:Phosphotyrosine protein phosphatase I domain-containing protein n=1 Tax=Candidatus Schekmanbacteria bacterium RIFCSPLOWO2_12_FULL_38_15 TaxID=1817883 RepID=A0A1F7SEC4_9BACT|nr:MAG: hypothetical protein A2043_07415 [Candidatus Schekmanbacteria bacterium GWA2_38_9]OGL49139.1 MAG: hypothetical protein A3H37_04180 [Candidatus Schekmanbacteria bacterium RIFCSPLOWO2_02_FULL_38_14]OGL51607.1 MAG: hypothetical protein A3C43_01075 [Candidatus Schekmanbacteria bacterium RIFCSPHIGHO2_02_FULL_38_11]OGL52115.1 MAG: hypothetical protein A3G31_06765 [Candidatus Schekmanbacteria bacterium RIFCSPLOWO2_12_FULL_38_15]